MGSGEAEASIGDTSTDILGNRASPFSQVFTIDSSPPVIGRVTIVGIGGLTGQVGEFITIGDRIGIAMNVTEDTEIAAVRANLSVFIPGASSDRGTCEHLNGSSFFCTIVSDSVERAATGVVKITVTDAAGNTATANQTVQTFGAINDSAPNFWMSSVSCSPKALDRQLGPLIEQRAYCAVALQPRSGRGSPRTVGISLAGCTGDQSGLLQAVRLFNANPGSTQPLIKLILKRDQLAINELKTSCTLNIFTLSGGAITRSPEQEIVPITLKFFDNPLGTLDEGVQKKVDAAMDATKGINALIGTLNKIMRIAEDICRIFQVIYNTINLLAFVVNAFGVQVDACSATGGGFLVGIGWCVNAHATKTAACLGQQRAETSADTGWTFVSKFCKWVNCQWSWPLEDMRKWSEEAINKVTPGAEYFKYFPEKSPAGAISPKSSLTTSILFACIPGIIENLDKYRQINCLYADCLQTAVVEDNIPITVCENLKAQATCKYITGEIFAVIPYTALFDRYVRMLKQALSDPFSAIGLAIGAACYFTCPSPESFSYRACEYVRIAAKLGSVIREVKAMIDVGLFRNPNDYCARLESQGNQTQSKFLGIF